MSALSPRASEEEMKRVHPCAHGSRRAATMLESFLIFGVLASFVAAQSNEPKRVLILIQEDLMDFLNPSLQVQRTAGIQKKYADSKLDLVIGVCDPIGGQQLSLKCRCSLRRPRHKSNLRLLEDKP
jgi:hypothetical protein